MWPNVSTLPRSSPKGLRFTGIDLDIQQFPTRALKEAIACSGIDECKNMNTLAAIP
jgi:hypothetical protein